MKTEPAGSPPPGGLLGRILFVGIEGTSLTPDLSRRLRRLGPGGVILFKRNVPTLPGLAALCSDLHALLEPAPILAIDEEGGRVSRLTPHVAGLPPAAAAARAGGAALREYWRRYGDLLAALGIDVDFAPVVDLCPPDAPNGIAERSFGTDPETVTSCAASVVEGLGAAGVLPALKHFPGLGPTLLDSHHHLPSVQKDREAFEREDLAPFASLAARAPAVMIGHGHYPYYAGPDPLAATLTKEIGTRLLRERLGFTGAAISDDLVMKAVAARVAWKDLAPRAVEAGCDMVLVCHGLERAESALKALEDRAAADRGFARRCEEAVSRVEALRRAAALARSAAVRTAAAPDAGRIDAARVALLGAAAEVAAAAA